jgi:transposase
MLPRSFGVTVPTAHRRFTVWTEAGLWRRLHQTVLDELGSRGLIDWSRAVIDAASVRAKKGDL